jgi:hypothetical protein
MDNSNPRAIRLAVIAKEWGWVGGIVLAYAAFVIGLIIWSVV